MAVYPQECPQCNLKYDIIKPMSEAGKKEVCQYCGGMLRRIFTIPAFIGNPFTKGGKKAFIHKGKKITSRKEWHKAGYRNPLDSPNLSSDMKAGIKRKIEKITKYDNKAKKHFTMGVT